MKLRNSALAVLSLATAATGAMGMASTASAAPALAASSVYIATLPSLSDCNYFGTDGVTKSVFTSYTCTSGIAGWSVRVVATPSHNSTFVSVGSPTSQIECQSRGNRGVTGGVWSNYNCVSGWAGYSLYVLG